MSAWDAPGRKRRRLVSKARDPFAGDDEPPAAHPEPFRGIRSGRMGWSFQPIRVCRPVCPLVTN